MNVGRILHHNLPKAHPVRRRIIRLLHTGLHATYFGFIAMEHSGVLGGVCAVLLVFSASEAFAEAIEFVPGAGGPE